MTQSIDIQTEIESNTHLNQEQVSSIHSNKDSKRVSIENDNSFTNDSNSLTFDSWSRALVLGDFNQDNKFDIVVVNSGRDNIDIFFEDENENFVNQTTYTWC